MIRASSPVRALAFNIMTSHHPLRDLLNQGAVTKHARKRAQNRLVRGRGSNGSLGDLASLAASAASSEKHYSGALKRIMEFKKASKKRTGENQAKFTWLEENKRLKSEANSLWKELNKLVMPPAFIGEMENLEKQWESSVLDMHDQLREVRQFAKDQFEAEKLEVAAILADFREAHNMIGGALDVEAETILEEVSAARNAVYASLRERTDVNDEQTDTLEKFGGDVWKTVQAIPFASEMDPSAVFEISQRLAQYQVKMMGEISALKTKAMAFETTEEVIVSAIDGGEIKREVPAKTDDNKASIFCTEVPVEKPDHGSAVKKTLRLFGGWYESTHAQFVKSWRECISRGKGRNALYAHFRSVCPEKKLEDVQRHAAEYEQWRFVKKEIKDKRIIWKRHVEEEIKHSTKLFEEEHNRRENEQRIFEDIQRQDMKREGLHTVLAELRQEYEKKQERVRAEEEAIQRVRDAEEADKKSKAEAEALRNKAITLEFQKQKRLEEEQAARLKEEQRAKDIEAAREQAPLLRARVNYRDKLHEEKNVKRRQALEAAILEKETREAVLENLKATCPYAEKLENMHDPERLFQATKAFEAAVAELDYLLANPEDSRLAKPLNGFSSKKITNDIRYKLAARLTTAGLQSTPYAQALMMKMARAQPVHRISKAAPFRAVGIVQNSAINW